MNTDNYIITLKDKEILKWIRKFELEKREEVVTNVLNLGRVVLEMSRVKFEPQEYIKTYIEPLESKFKETTMITNQTLKDVSEAITGQLKTGYEKQLAMMHPISERIQTLCHTVDGLIEVKNKSVLRGQFGETLITTNIRHAFPDHEIKNQTKNPHESDIHFIDPDIGLILMEIKTYTNNVPTREIEKFYNDMEQTNSKYGIFVSTTSGIVGKKSISWEVHPRIKKSIIIYVPEAGFDAQSVVLALAFIKMIAMTIDPDDQDVDRIPNTCIKTDEYIILKNIRPYFDILRKEIENVGKIRGRINRLRDTMNRSIDELYKVFVESEISLQSTMIKIMDEIGKKYKRSLFGLTISDDDNISKYLDELKDDKRLIGFTVLKDIIDKIPDIAISIEKETKTWIIVCKKYKGKVNVPIAYTSGTKNRLDIRYLLNPLNKEMSGISINLKIGLEDIKDCEIIIPICNELQIRSLLEERFRLYI